MKRPYSRRWRFKLGMICYQLKHFELPIAFQVRTSNSWNAIESVSCWLKPKHQSLEITSRFNLKPIFTFKPTIAKSIWLLGLPK
jgi:hypothetical protein